MLQYRTIMIFYDKDGIKLPENPGIYLLRNKINNKIYIGKTILEFSERIQDHIKPSRKQVISRAIQKYGWKNFEIEILQEYEEIDDWTLLALETAFIDFYDATNREIGYNLCLFGNNSFGLVITEERRKNIRAGWVKRKEKGLGRTTLGYKATEEQKRKMSESMKGRFVGEKNPFYGKKHSEETKAAISKSRTGKNTGVDNCNFGKPMLPHVKEAIRKAVLGSKQSEELKKWRSEWCKKNRCGINNPNFGKLLTKEHKNKLSRKIVQIDKESNSVIKIWDSVKEAAETLGLKSKYSLTRALYSEEFTCKGTKWMYLENSSRDKRKDSVNLEENTFIPNCEDFQLIIS